MTSARSINQHVSPMYMNFNQGSTFNSKWPSHMLQDMGDLGYEGMESLHPSVCGIVPSFKLIWVRQKCVRFSSSPPIKLVFGLLFSSFVFPQSLENDYDFTGYVSYFGVLGFKLLYESLIFKNDGLYIWFWHLGYGFQSTSGLNPLSFSTPSLIYFFQGLLYFSFVFLYLIFWDIVFYYAKKDTLSISMILRMTRKELSF